MSDMVLGQHPLLKKQFVDKRLHSLIGHQFMADKLFTQTDVNALAIKYFKEDGTDEDGRITYDEVNEVAEGSTYKRIGLDEEERQALVRKYGLEVAVSKEMEKYAQTSIIERSYRKLAVNIRYMVDSMAYDVATNGYSYADGTIQGGTAGDWSRGKNIIDDLVSAKKEIDKLGYKADTLVLSPDVEHKLLLTPEIRRAFMENSQDIALQRGYLGDLLGMSIVSDEHFKPGYALLCNRRIIGDIADATPLTSKVYPEEQNDRTIVRASRFTTAYLTDPKAVFLLDGLEQ